MKLLTFKRTLLISVPSERAQKQWINVLRAKIGESPEYSMAEKM